jgi:amino acid transporter
MLYTLAICTVLYVLITLVLTGMVNYTELAVGDPLAFVFDRVNLNFMAGIISVSAIVALTSVLLVFQLGQPRIWMSMSRDGLLPKAFSRIHPRFNTPSFSTVVTGFVVAIPALFMNLTEVTDLTSIGTLFAFVLVCGGILLMERTEKVPGRFKVPYINGKFIVPALLAGIALYMFINHREIITQFFTLDQTAGDFWDLLEHKILAFLFIVFCVWISWLTFTKNLSLIPVLGLLTNLYLMSELGITNWSRFLAWLLLGLVVYFGYSYHNSKLGKSESK